MPNSSSLIARIVFGAPVFAVLATAILTRPAKWLTHFDQSLYLTIACDLNHHGVFSNGVFDAVDITAAAPPPGMFFAPLYPWLIVAASKLDPRFGEAVDCSVEANHQVRDGAQCEVYATPMHIIHAVLLTIGVLAIAFAGERIFERRGVFWLAGMLATTALLAFGVIPFGPGWTINGWSVNGVVADVPIGLIVIFALGSIGIYGFIVGGWASESKYSLLGSMRTCAQLVSYEVSLALSVLGGVLMVLPLIVAPNNPDPEKLSAYECGFNAFDDARLKFDVRFYLVAILFIIFDLEVAFLFPWAVAFGKLGATGFWSMVVFLAVLTVGFAYEWKKGALEWD